MASLVELTVDDQPVDSVRVRGAFDEALAAIGFTRIEAAAAGVTSAADAEKGLGHPAADLVVVARIDSRKLGAGFGGTSLVRYEASAEARILATETGELLGVITAVGPGIDVDPASAGRIAGAHAAKALARALAEKADTLLASPRNLEVVISEVPDSDEAQRIVDGLGALPGVENAAIATRDGRGARSKTTVRMATRRLSTSAVADLLGRARGLGLSIESHTLRRVFSTYDATRRISIGVTVPRLSNKTGHPREDAMMPPLTRVLRTALGGAPAMIVQDEGPFTVRGSIHYVGKTDVAIELALLDPGGAVIRRTRRQGPEARFGRTVRRAAADLHRRALSRVLDDPSLRQIASIPTGLSTPPAVDGRIAGVDVGPGMVGEPIIVDVELKSSDTTLDDLVVEVRDRQGKLWSTTRVDHLGVGASTTVRLEGPVPEAIGTVDVIATVHDRVGGRWIVERERATVPVRPMVATR